jgi:hypothetical protein
MGERRGVYRGFGGETRGKETTWKTQMGGKYSDGSSGSGM